MDKREQSERRLLNSQILVSEVLYRWVPKNERPQLSETSKKINLKRTEIATYLIRTIDPFHIPNLPEIEIFKSALDEIMENAPAMEGPIENDDAVKAIIELTKKKE